MFDLANENLEINGADNKGSNLSVDFANDTVELVGSDDGASQPADFSKLTDFSQCEIIVFRILLFTLDPNYLYLFFLKCTFNTLGAVGALVVVAVYWSRAQKHQR